ncbi:Predicted protein [Komagataella phaffii CBS 7435]|nr:Predicted protein [Komagataella phaffii CBS 7435]
MADSGKFHNREKCWVNKHTFNLFHFYHLPPPTFLAREIFIVSIQLSSLSRSLLLAACNKVHERIITSVPTNSKQP